MSVEGSENLPTAKNYTNVYIDQAENALALKVVGGTDVSITLDFSELFLSTVEYTGLEIEYMIPKTNSSVTSCSSSVYFSTSDNTGITSDKVVSSGTLKADGVYHTMTFDFTKKADYWTGDIKTLRFDYFQNAPKEGDVMYIKRITFKRADMYDVVLAGEGSEKSFASTAHSTVSFDENENAIKLCVNGGADVKAYMDLRNKGLSTSDYTQLVVRYMIPTTNSKSSYSSTVYFTTSDSAGESEDKAIYRTLTVDGNYHTVVFDLDEKGTWTGDIAKLRFDYFQGACVNGDVIFIQSISLK
jgi:hypothetical protein